MMEADASSGACNNGKLDDGEACDPGIDGCCADDCSGPAKADVVCRKAAGTCDVAEKCDGKSVDCPKDKLKPDTTVCRAQNGKCDVVDYCTGDRADCPRDEVVQAGVECRKSAGDCDVAEECNGNDAACPADKFLSASKVCRASTGGCDAEEKCPGDGADCPDDVGVCDIQAITDAIPLRKYSIDTSGTCDQVALSCSPASAPDQLFSFKAPATDTYWFTVYSASVYTNIAVLESLSCAANELGCSNGYTGSGRIAVALTKGKTVVIAVEGNEGTNASDIELYIASSISGWRCPPSWYGGGDGCDCGCGLVDADCASADDTACDYCPPCGDGSETCTDVLVDNNNALCDLTNVTNNVPVSWSCDISYYGDGSVCDCGCGEVDPDCDTMDPALCGSCANCGDSDEPCANSASIDFGDNTICR
jgi:hypothetical protein